MATTKKQANSKALARTKRAVAAPDQHPLHVEMMPILSVRAYGKNPRVIPDSAVSKVAASITEFGWQQPIVVDEQNTIIVGHTRLMAASKLGMTHVPVHVARGLTKAQAKAYRLADNRVGQESTWDEEMKAEELTDLRLLDYDLALLGFDQNELDKAFARNDVRDSSTKEIDPEEFALGHTCPRCQFKFND